MDWLKERDPLLAFEYEMSKFFNAIGCEGHSRPLRYVTAECLKKFYYIFKREEIEEWFHCICMENRLICGYCEDCYTCRRFHFIKQEIHKLGYFDRRDWPCQEILWQVHENIF